IVLAPTLERAEALASELRLAVQRQRDAFHAQRTETEEAKKLLEELPEDAPVPLLRALEHVAAGVERMDAALRDAAPRPPNSAAGGRVRAAVARAGARGGRRRTHGRGPARCRATHARQRGRRSRTA